MDRNTPLKKFPGLTEAGLSVDKWAQQIFNIPFIGGEGLTECKRYARTKPEKELRSRLMTIACHSTGDRLPPLIGNDSGIFF
jgi:hypothetical protein